MIPGKLKKDNQAMDTNSRSVSSPHGGRSLAVPSTSTNELEKALGILPRGRVSHLLRLGIAALRVK